MDGTARRRPIISQLTDDLFQIDTVMAGEREFNSIYFIASSEPVLIESGPAADFEVVLDALSQLGVDGPDLSHVVVSHIHLDHAGGTGQLAEAFPRATFHVHTAGAPHMQDPSRLVSSTARTYGEARMLALFGAPRPVSAERIRTVEDGDVIRAGDISLEVIHTQGHASHHIALFEPSSGSMFTGEAIGSYMPWANCFRPALPPPEVDIEKSLASISRIASKRPSRLLTSHFGIVPDPERACALAQERVTVWAERVRSVLSMTPEADTETVALQLKQQAEIDFLRDSGRPLTDEMSRYNFIGSIEMNANGLARYWRKKWEAESAS